MGPTLSKTVVSFCHELFQKDQPHLMDQMKEIASSKARIGSSEAKEAPEMDFLRTADYRNSGGSASSLYSDILSQSGSSQHLLTALNRNYAPSHSSEGLLPQQLQQRQQQQRSLRDLGGPHSLPQNFQRNSLLSNLERENTLLQALRQQQQNERLLQQRIDDMARQNALAQLQQQLQQLQQRDWESTAARLSRLAGTGNDLSTSDRARLEALLVENQQRQGSSVLFPNSAPSSSGQLSTEDLSSLLGSQLPTGANDGTNNQTTSSRDSELLNALMIREFLQRRQSQQRNDHGSNSGNANTF